MENDTDVSLAEATPAQRPLLERLLQLYLHDFSERLPTASWERLSYLVAMPERYQGITFRLRKEGGGRAVLAQIRAREAEECEGAPLAQPVSPLGAGCWDTDD